MTFTITSAHFNIDKDSVRSLLSSMIGSMNFRAIAYARMALRNDAYEEQQQKMLRGYAQFSDEPNIDKRAEADNANTERAERNNMGTDAGFNIPPSPHELASKLMLMRGFFVDRMHVVGMRSPRDEPSTISDSLAYLLTLDPIRDKEQIQALAIAMDLPFEAMLAAKIEEHETDTKRLAKSIGQIKSYLANYECEDVDEGDVEDAFNALPAPMQHKIVTKVIEVYDRAAAYQMKIALRANFEAAANFKLLQAKRADAVEWINDLEVRKRLEIAEYLDQGGSLKSFDPSVITENEPSQRTPRKQIEVDAEKAASARLAEDLDAKVELLKKSKMQRAPKPAPVPA